MLLVADIGNTNIVFGLFEADKLKVSWRLRTQVEASSDEYAVFLDSRLRNQEIAWNEIEAVVLSSVVPKVLANLEQTISSCSQAGCFVIGKQPLDQFISINIANPKQAGADRLVNSWAAWRIYGGANIVIDFGTATTFDVIDHNCTYQGGVITPGPQVAADALYRATAQLPPLNLADLHANTPIIGKTTSEALAAGLFWGYSGLLQGIIKQLQTQLVSEDRKTKYRVIGTGGMARLFHSAKLFDIIDQQLMLQGLALLARDNGIYGN